MIKINVIGLRGFPNIQGGVEKHCQEMFSRLALQELEVLVIFRKGYISDYSNLFKNVRIQILWTPRKKSLETIVHTAYGILWLAFQDRKTDILHIHAIGPSLLTPLARLLGFTVVVTNHGPDYDRQKWGRFAKFMLKLGERLGTRYANQVIAVSKHIRDLIKEKYNREAVYIPNGVPIPEKIPPGLTLEKFSLQPGRYILAVGRLVPEKGFHDLVEAFKTIRTDWNLAIVGGADHKDAYSRNLKQQAESVPGLVMTGFQKGQALGELYSNAGLFVLPSYHEGLPIVGLEAMSYELPMIVSDIPANLEIAQPHEIFPTGNVHALKEKLEKFLENPTAWNSDHILRIKRERLETEFNWDIIAEQTAEVYKTALGRY